MTYDRETIRRIVLEVIKELAGRTPTHRKKSPGDPMGPRVLAVFHGGLRFADEALRQVRTIEAVCSKFAVYTVESTRGNVCGGDVRERAGVQCILDTVSSEGLEKVMDRSDLVLAPTFCLMTASKISRLTGDDPGSSIILKALVRNKKVLAANDGFQILDGMVNQAVRSEVTTVLKKLEDWGMIFCRTDRLAEVFSQMAAPDSVPPETPVEIPAGLKLVSGGDVTTAFNEKRKKVYVSRGGIVTPLARDLAKEYSIEIVKGG